MNAIVIGLGSMGKRRARLLKERDGVRVYGVDSQASRRAEAAEKLGIPCCESLEAALAEVQADCAFVCTSPLSHAGLIRRCLEAGLHVFTEINLVPDAYADNVALAREKGRVLFLSSTFLYRKETQYIIDRVRRTDGPLNYLYHVGQYLPDWHPWESYQGYFIGQARTNGCREILAIDLPWIVSAFGDIAAVTARKSRNTGLDIRYPDNYLILLEHASGAKGVFAADVVSRKAVRHFEAYGEQLHLSWDGEPETLFDYDIAARQDRPVILEDASEHVAGYASFVTENPYREEIDAFLRQIAEPDYRPAWDFDRDGTVLGWIDEIEK